LWFLFLALLFLDDLATESGFTTMIALTASSNVNGWSEWGSQQSSQEQSGSGMSIDLL
jgi:hypothetical protein